MVVVIGTLGGDGGGDWKHLVVVMVVVIGTLGDGGDWGHLVVVVGGDWAAWWWWWWW